MKTKIFAFLHAISFVILASVLAFEFEEKSTRSIILLSSLIGTLLFGTFSVFNKELWTSAHGQKADFAKSYKWLAISLVVIIMTGSVAYDFGNLPESFDFLKLLCWLTIYLIYLTPNLTYIFSQSNRKIEA